ncbi:hypothetical protein R1flu_013155 [Riccia fluitans]|uniref:Uncharacterized protein n=1 Tax=Riccia fluitans TaxID=41844 RepID=A0ABD1XGP7_9MARC
MKGDMRPADLKLSTNGIRKYTPFQAEEHYSRVEACLSPAYQSLKLNIPSVEPISTLVSEIFRRLERMGSYSLRPWSIRFVTDNRPLPFYEDIAYKGI